MSHEPHLKMGDHGHEVEYVQNVMEQMGVPAGKHPDGVFDQHTHDQVVAFQEHHG
ncbi:MAG: putative peptidoglycan binding domain, partial [Pseudonocardiales bacterium]|nr:putative peptidoglycan binding domain [Pseudonocardiales bacterium]